MAQTTVYIKAERNTQMQTDDVFLKDIASLYCEDKVVLARVKAIKLHTFHEKLEKRFFISMTEVIELIKEAVTGVEVESIGEPDMIAERVYVEKKRGAPEVLKILLVSLVCFFIFFNHIGGRRITKDPTPIEVEMSTYEEDVEKTLIKTASREGREIDTK